SQVYVRTRLDGLANATRIPFEGAYLYATAQYDSVGNLVSLTDIGASQNGGRNVTRHEYSQSDNQDYETKTTRPDGKQSYHAYDFQTGVRYGNLEIDCRRTRTQYDAIGRAVKAS